MLRSSSHKVLVANLGLMGPPSGMTVHLSWKHTTDERRWRDMAMVMMMMMITVALIDRCGRRELYELMWAV